MVNVVSAEPELRVHVRIANLIPYFLFQWFQVLKAFAKNHPVKISFRYPLTSQTVLTWDTTLMRDNLYIGIPEGCLPDASKEAFVELLEFAEEKLHCQFAIVYFKKDRVDRGEYEIVLAFPLTHS